MKPILTSQEGIELYQHQKAFIVTRTQKGNYLITEKALSGFEEREGSKFFASIEAAELHVESLYSPKRYAPTLALRRSVKLTKENSNKVHTNLVDLEFVLRTADYIYREFPDVDLKSPVIHQKLKNAYNYIKDARSYVGKMIFIQDEDTADESVALFCNISKNIMRLDIPALNELNDNLEKVVAWSDKAQAS